MYSAQIALPDEIESLSDLNEIAVRCACLFRAELGETPENT
jgi:hypothetical protein